MKTTGHTDLRVQKTMDAIRSTFEKMICEMSFEKMTVKELCERARINKKTFYRYYDGLDFLLAEMQEEISAEYIERIAGYEIPEDLGKITREFFAYSEEKGVAYERITCSGNYERVRNNMINNVMDQTWRQSPMLSKYDADEQNIVIAYVTAASVEIYKQWVADEKRIPLDTIITMSSKLLCAGIDGLQS